MSYYITRTISGSFDEIIEKTRISLANQGFGVITEVDLKATFKNKLEKDFKNYRILGACNPNLAFQAVQQEDKIGTLLPCNVTVIEQGDNQIEVSIVDPITMLETTGNKDMTSFAGEVKTMLQNALNNI